MITLAKSKIENLQYKNPGSIKELFKLLGASKFVILSEARGYTPPYDAYFIAVDELNSIENKERTGNNEKMFSETQLEALESFTKLQDVLTQNNISGSSSLGPLLRGEEVVRKEDEITFALLMVEQNNIDYFKDKPSHLPSQPHERLSTHYIIHSSGGQYTFAFPNDSKLPKYIQDEALEAVKRTVEGFGK